MFVRDALSVLRPSNPRATRFDAIDQSPELCQTHTHTSVRRYISFFARDFSLSPFSHLQKHDTPPRPIHQSLHQPISIHLITNDRHLQLAAIILRFTARRTAKLGRCSVYDTRIGRPRCHVRCSLGNAHFARRCRSKYETSGTSVGSYQSSRAEFDPSEVSHDDPYRVGQTFAFDGT